MVKSTSKGAFSVLKKFQSGSSVTRRQFMERAAALGVSTAVANSVWTQAVQASPTKGGHLKVGAEGGASNDTLDTAKAIGTNHITLGASNIYDRLIEIDASGKPVGQLAESFEGSNGGKTWRVVLRDGVEFHNGKALTPEDVIYSMRHAGSEASTFAEGQVTMGKIDEIKVDGNALTFELNGANADFPFELSALGFLIAPEGTSGDDWKQGIGTGPYMMENFDPGVSFTGRKNPNYYREDEGHFESFELLNIADVNARTTALITGDVHIASRPDPKVTDRLSGAANIELVLAEGTQHYTSPMHTGLAPFDDQNVRLAMKHIVDRQELLDKVLFGYGYIGNDIPIGRNQQFYNDELPQRAYDPERAKFYLNKAGISSLDVTLSAADAAFAGALDAGVLIAESASKAGINVTVDRVPNDGYWSEVWLKKPWCFSYWAGRPTVGQMLSSGFLTGGDWNESHWGNERFDTLVAEAAGELDEAKRKEMYFEAQELLYNDSGVIIPVFASLVHAASTDLGHNGFRGNRYFDNDSIIRTGWLKG